MQLSMTHGLDLSIVRDDELNDHFNQALILNNDVDFVKKNRNPDAPGFFSNLRSDDDIQSPLRLSPR